MITSVNQHDLSDIFPADKDIVFKIPLYQREYDWTKYQRESLFDDIDENDLGYFLGSIICIHQTRDPHDNVQYQDVVDGQQRLVALSLLLAAHYQVLKKRAAQHDFENSVYELETLKRRIVRSSNDEARVIPQIQNNNKGDYRTVLSNIGLIQDNLVPNNFGNRRISQTFEYFRNRIDKLDLDEIIAFLRKLERTCFVKIHKWYRRPSHQVSTVADAYTLFNSLNNRGLPLTIVDVIKNTLLARLDKLDGEKLTRYYNQWSRLLENLQHDYRIQERFLRQFYNVFKTRYQIVAKEDIATRTKLLPIYEKLINNDAESFFQEILRAGEHYSIILSPAEDKSISNTLEKHLLTLGKIQAAPSYALLLYLFEKREGLRIEDDELSSIIDTLVRFFVRRHLTDTPPTRELDRFFMQIANNLEQCRRSLSSYIKEQLIKVSAPDEEFIDKLGGPIYYDNATVTRFILCALAERTMTREFCPDLWIQKHKRYDWTVEHIFPQGENIPDEWIQMIANGNREEANKIQVSHVHKLGNLTITKYNSKLSNMSFERKRDRKDENHQYIGYRNSLSLNEDLKLETAWTKNKIENRTKNLVVKSMELFNLQR